MSSFKDVYIHPAAVLLGDVKIGKNSSVWPGASIRADFNSITVGEYTSIQDNVVIHATPFNGTVVGDYVTVGHAAVLHACKIGDNVLVGMNSTILDGAVIGDNSVIAAGSVVLPGTEVPEGSLVIGVPGKVKEGKAVPAERIKQGALLYYELSRRHMRGEETFSPEEVFEAMKKYGEVDK
jgi:carbonic anhydrase/acetyltransferase-like protein (isoleucine patch superfamily)